MTQDMLGALLKSFVLILGRRRHWLGMPIMFLLPPTAPHPTSGWAALACLVQLHLWPAAAAPGWHNPKPGPAWKVDEGSRKLWQQGTAMEPIPWNT